MSWVSTSLPAGARRTAYDVPGGALAGMQVDGDRGPVLLVPGFSGSKEDFGPLLPLLGAAGWRAVALDLRGQNESTGPDDPAAYTVDALAAEVAAVVELLGPPVHLVGHSFGGLVARRAALERPAAVASLTLMSSGPQALTGPRVDILDLLPDVLAAGGMGAVADASEAMSAEDPAGQDVPEEVRRFLRERWLRSSGTGLVGMADALRSEPDRVDALRGTGLPLLVLHGIDDDAWEPAVQAEMALRLGAVYRVVRGRHSPAVEDPEGTAAALLGFWA